MLFRSYSLRYSAIGENLILAKMSENIPQNPSGEWILSHTIDLIDIPRYQVDDCRNYLASNGLFLGIFPPNLIEEEIIYYHKTQKEAFERAKREFEDDCRYIWSEKDFEELNDGRHRLDDILRLLNRVNQVRKERLNLQPIDIDKTYGKYLKKYWGEEYGNE